MVRRLVWLVMGMGVGLGTSFWVMRVVRETAARYTPERMSADLAETVRGFGTDVRLAVSEGREAMQAREAELHAELDRAR
jgi:hypothetical protein